MHRILSTVAVAYEPIGSDFVIIRARLTFNYRHGRNAERNLGQDRRFENSLWSEKTNPRSLEFETRCQDFARQSIGMYCNLFLQKLECFKANPGIQVLHVGKALFPTRVV